MVLNQGNQVLSLLAVALGTGSSLSSLWFAKLNELE